MTHRNRPTERLLLALSLQLFTAVAFAQASPFETGANSLVTFLQTLATPVAAIIVIGVGIAAAIGKISWGWVIGVLLGVAAIFGAPTIVAWIRQMFAV